MLNGNNSQERNDRTKCRTKCWRRSIMKTLCTAKAAPSTLEAGTTRSPHSGGGLSVSAERVHKCAGHLTPSGVRGKFALSGELDPAAEPFPELIQRALRPLASGTGGGPVLMPRAASAALMATGVGKGSIRFRNSCSRASRRRRPEYRQRPETTQHALK